LMSSRLGIEASFHPISEPDCRQLEGRIWFADSRHSPAVDLISEATRTCSGYLTDWTSWVKQNTWGILMPMKHGVSHHLFD
jgi:hypothetical protein